jgi:hypothetical protein
MRVVQYVCDTPAKADKAVALCIQEGCPAAEVKRKQYANVSIFGMEDGNDPECPTIVDENDSILVTAEIP